MMLRQDLITFFSLFFVIFYVVKKGECLYEDQVGKFDWSIQHIGKAKFVHYVHNGQYAKRIVVATEQNVLALLNGKNGALGWRHVFEKSSIGQIDDMLVSGQNVIVVNSGGLKVRCFNLASGSIKWETSIASDDIDHKASMQLLNNDPGTVIVSTALRMYSLAVDSGLEKWNVRLTNDNESAYSQLSQVDGNIVDVKVRGPFSMTVSGFHKEVQNNQPTWTLLFQRRVAQRWISTDKKKCGVSSGGKYFVCLDENNWKLHAISLSNDERIISISLDDLSTSFVSPSFVKLEDNIGILGIDVVALKLKPDHVVVFSINEDQLKLIHNLKGVTAVQTVIFSGEVYIGMLLRTTSEALEFSAHGLLSNEIIKHSLKFPSHHGRPFEFYGTSLKDSLSLLVISEDESIVSIQNSGKFMWTREESLSNILSTEMVDLPVSKIMAKMEDEFGVEENILQMFVKRFTTQFSQLKTFITQLKQRFFPSHHHHHHHRHQQNQGSEEDEDVELLGNGNSGGEDSLDETYLTRDEFNLHKIVVAVTASGKIFGIDSATGKNIWKIFVPDLEPFKVMERKSVKLVMPLFVQRSTSHFPHQPVCTMLGKSKTTGKTLLFSFHPISGTPIPDNEDGGELLDFKVINTMMLHQFDDHFLYPILLLDDQHKIHVVPESAKDLVARLSPTLFMFSVDSQLGSVTGYSIVSKGNKLEAEQLWSLDLGRNSQSITGVYSKPANEHVHSVGLALEDRSVLYKYLNPNLVVVVTEGEDASQKEGQLKGMFNVYLIDSVSGSIIFHCNHKKSKGPVNVIHSENWVVYNFWNQKQRRNELAVLEMFEGKVQTNATAFSSLNAPPQPLVMRQAYIFPGHLAALGVTLTEKGLTNKELLFALESGAILGLPKVFIDPRRPEVMSHESREEGLIPYIPELPKQSDRIINYYQTVHNIKQIRASPAGLESTSLVFCFGLDMFFTRVTPSKMFDVLKEDFDYFFISSVLIGMIVVSLVSQKLASRKILNRAWK